MRQLLALLTKEFRQLRRDSAMLKIIFIMPIIQLMILSFAINTDVKQMRIAIIDYDRTPESRALAQSAVASDYFAEVRELPVSMKAGELGLDQSRFDMFMTIPAGFARELQHSTKVSLIVDGQNSNVGALSSGYAARLIAQFNQKQLTQRREHGLLPNGADATIQAAVRFRYNSELNTRFFMVPGIVVLLITIISAMLSGIAIVKESEIGTIELLMVAPLRKWQMIGGKLLPFFIVAIFETMLALMVGMIVFGIPFVGSPIVLLVGISLYLIVTLSLGLFVSTVSSTQMQAMFSIWFFLIFAILTSGFFFPIENMPTWLQKLTLFNPMRYLIEIVRAVLLKGSGFQHLYLPMLSLAGLGGVMFTLSVARFKQRIS